jgi:hypothetical protein
MKVFILVVISITGAYGGVGQSVAFQEFNSLESCQKNAKYINGRVATAIAYCTEK